MEGMPTQLSKDVLAVAYDYERVEIENNRTKYLVRASKATTFTDNHQELEDVYIEVYDETGEKKDVLTSRQAVYIPTDGKNFKVFFFDSVKIETRDSLVIKAGKLGYDKATEIAETEGETEFFRQETKGRALKARAIIPKGEVELFGQVNIDFEGEKGQKAEIKSDYAKFNKENEKIIFEGNVFFSFHNPDSFVLKGSKLICLLSDKDLKRLEIVGNAEVVQEGDRSLKANSDLLQAEFNGDLKKINFLGNARVETSERGKFPTFSSANSITYDRAGGRILLQGGATITQHRDDSRKIFVKGDTLQANLSTNGKIKSALSKGNVYLRQELSDRVIESRAFEMSVFYTEDGWLKNANAVGNASITITPSIAGDYSRATLFAPKAIIFSFAENALSQVQSQGRTTIFLSALPDKENSSNRKLTADRLKTFLGRNGREINRVEALGNVVVEIEPVNRSKENHRTTITSEQLNCDFYENNSLKFCIAYRNAKAVQEPFSGGRERVLTAERFSVEFDKLTQQSLKYEAFGKARYSEGDRYGIANQIVFTESDGMIRLRGGEPTIWDSKARARAGEIDWDTRQNRSFLRLKVSTTYYNQRQSDGTLPFTNPSAPVYITADRADFDHKEETATYYGNARAWQSNNYVRAEKLVLQAKLKKLIAEGFVQTSIYKVRKEDKEQPVFVSSDSLIYTDERRLARYDGNVDVRQGSDRINSNSAEIFLSERNELVKAVVSGSVRITQPNRQALGDYAEYEAETVILRGSPAIVVDMQQGELRGAQMIVNLKDNRVTSNGKVRSEIPSGRTRSVYRVKN